MSITAATECLVGPREANHLSLRPVRRVNPTDTSFWEGNWLTVEVEVRAGSFGGRFQAELRADELQDFQLQLEALRGALEGTARLESVEGWVRLEVTPGPQGRLLGVCEVRDDPTGGSRLRFNLGVDQVQLLDLLDGLRQLLLAYPVTGSPEEEADPPFPPLDEPEPGPA
jgi:hypothetical protein